MDKQQEAPPPYAQHPPATFPGGKEGDNAGHPQQPLTQGQQPPGYAYPPQQGGYPQQPGYAQPPVYAQQPGYPPQQGYPQQGYYQQQPVVMAQPVTVTQQFVGGTPPNHSTLAWLTCLFCCWPLGLVAIIKSNEVDSAAARGDMMRANHASQSARRFGYASLGFGIGSYVIAAIILIIYLVVVIPSINSIYD